MVSTLRGALCRPSTSSCTEHFKRWIVLIDLTVFNARFRTPDRFCTILRQGYELEALHAFPQRQDEERCMVRTWRVGAIWPGRFRCSKRSGNDHVGTGISRFVSLGVNLGARGPIAASGLMYYSALLVRLGHEMP